MTEPKPKAKGSRWPVLMTTGLIVVVAAVFAVAFIAASQSAANAEAADITADSYMDIVEPLLENADASRGENLVLNELPCASCHVQGAGTVAPTYDEIAEGADGRTPLTVAAYIYESIVSPYAYTVEGYPNSMPANYRSLLSDEQLGDIIAYLLTFVDAEDVQ